MEVLCGSWRTVLCVGLYYLLGLTRGLLFVAAAAVVINAAGPRASMNFVPPLSHFPVEGPR